MSYEDFLKAVKEEAVRMTMQAFEREEAEAKIEDAWNELYEDFGDKLFKDQFEAIQWAKSKYADGKMKEEIYKARTKNEIGTAAWNVWMLA